MNRRLIISLVLFLGTSSLVFAQEAKTNPTATVAKQDSIDNQPEITITDNRIKVANAPIGVKLEVFSIVGIKVKEIEMKEAFGEYTLYIAKGYYIVRLGETTRKLVIR